MLFISYSTRNRDLAEEVHVWLTSKGYRTFLAHHPEDGIHGGSRWEHELRWQVKVARGVIILHSAEWSASKWCFAELTMAKAHEKPIIPLIADDAPLPAELTSIQGVRFADRAPETYERIERALEVAGIVPGDGFHWPRDECPYPGLAPFTEEHAAVYFGREAELDRFLEDCVRPMRDVGDPRLVYVIGPSGSGKSSFVRAGVIPRLRYDPSGPWQILGLFRWADLRRDGVTWGERLALDLQDLYGDHASRPEWDATERRGRYRSEPDGQSVEEAAQRYSLDVKDLMQAVGGKGTRPLLVLDQFEELLAPDKAEGPDASDLERSRTERSTRPRRDFLRFLSHCLGDADASCRGIATIRSDFLPAIQENPDLTNWGQHTRLFRLDLLRDERLLDVVQRPADQVEVDFEDDALVRRIVGDARTADALPLLAFMLKRFYEADVHRGTLTAATYTELGGLGRCLQIVADGVLHDDCNASGRVGADAEEALRLSFVRDLVQYRDGQDAGASPFVRRRAEWATLPDEAKPLIESMSSEEHRLVRVDQMEGGAKTVEVTHEALFRQWGTLARWLADRRDLIRWRNDVMRSRDAAGDGWTGLSRAQYVVTRGWPPSWASELTENEGDWIGRARRHYARRTAGVIGALFIFAALAVAALVFWSSAEVQGRRVAMQVATAALQSARQSDERGAVGAAAWRSWFALQSLEEADPRRGVAGLLLSGAVGRCGDALVHDEPVMSVAFSADGTLLAVGCADGSVCLWSVEDKRLVHSGWSVDNFAFSVAFAAEDRLVLASGLGTAKAWDIESGECVRSVVGPSGSVPSVFVSGGESCILTTETEGVRLWHPSEERPDLVLKGRWQGRCRSDGSVVVTLEGETLLHRADIREWRVMPASSLQLAPWREPSVRTNAGGLSYRSIEVAGVGPRGKAVYVERRNVKDSQPSLVLEKYRCVDGQLLTAWQFEPGIDSVTRVFAAEECVIASYWQDRDTAGLFSLRPNGEVRHLGATTTFPLYMESPVAGGHRQDRLAPRLLSLDMEHGRSLQFLDAVNGSHVGAWCSHPDTLTSVALHSRLRLLATGCSDGVTRLWTLPPRGLRAIEAIRESAAGSEAEIVDSVVQDEGAGDGSAQPLPVVGLPQAQCICHTADGQTVTIRGDTSGYLHFLAGDGSQLGGYVRDPLQVVEGEIHSLKFHPGTRLLLVGVLGRTLLIEDPLGATRDAAFKSVVAPGVMKTSLVSADGKYVAVLAEEARQSFGWSVLFWHLLVVELQSGSQVHREFSDVEKLLLRAISSDGSRVIVSANGCLELDGRTLDVIASFPQPSSKEHSLIVENGGVHEIRPDGARQFVHRLTSPLQEGAAAIRQRLIQRTGLILEADGSLRRLGQSEWTELVRASR